MKLMKLCSACLLGLPCRFDGCSKPNPKVLELASKEILIPICPEQLGGLPTPRNPGEINSQGRVLNPLGEDITEFFEKGAKYALEIAKLYGIKEAVLKQKSPSCGCGKIYDRTFSGTLIEGDGITASLFKKNGIKVVSEEEL